MLVCHLTASRRSGGRQRRVQRTRKRCVRQMRCTRPAFVGGDEGHRRFRSAAAVCGIVTEELEEGASEADYCSAEELDVDGVRFEGMLV